MVACWTPLKLFQAAQFELCSIYLILEGVLLLLGLVFAAAGAAAAGNVCRHRGV
jgi:uncharacterized membrane protein YsdA (DUF1294 family)